MYFLIFHFQGIGLSLLGSLIFGGKRPSYIYILSTLRKPFNIFYQHVKQKNLQWEEERAAQTSPEHTGQSQVPLIIPLNPHNNPTNQKQNEELHIKIPGLPLNVSLKSSISKH